MRAAVYREPGQIVVRDVPRPAADTDAIVLDVLACGVCGSDLDSWRTGAHTVPGQVLGHELVARVHADHAATGLLADEPVVVRPMVPCTRCRACLRGDWQLCPHVLEHGVGYGVSGGFAEQVVLPAPILDLTVFRWPTELPLDLGALVEPLAVSLHGLHRARLQMGQTVVVFGLGPIGLGAVALARAFGVEHIIAIDPSANRRSAARELGADTTVDPMSDRSVDAVREVTGPGNFGLGAAADVAVECSGAPSAFTDAVKCLGPGGRLALIAHSRDPFAVKSGRLIEKEIDVVGAFCYRNEFAEVIHLLRTGRIEVDAMISHRLPLERIGDAFATQADPEASRKVLVLPT